MRSLPTEPPRHCSAQPLAASSLLHTALTAPDQPPQAFTIRSVALQDGVDLVFWKGRHTQPLALQIHDDMHRISFSCALAGHAQTCLNGAGGPDTYALQAGDASISFNPGRRGSFVPSGDFASVSVMVAPQVWETWRDSATALAPAAVSAGDHPVRCGPCSAELRATAHALGQAMAPALGRGFAPGRSPVWLLGQSLTLVGLILEAADPRHARQPQASQHQQQRLLKARDRLLQDLSAAPTLAELARETGLSALQLQRGFRSCFHHSVYGLFQHERMQAARQRLSAGDPVMRVAADFGYTNASHFAAAFHKQFGVKPSAIKRAGRL